MNNFLQSSVNDANLLDNLLFNIDPSIFHTACTAVGHGQVEVHPNEHISQNGRHSCRDGSVILICCMLRVTRSLHTSMAEG